MTNKRQNNPIFRKLLEILGKCADGKFHNWLSLTFGLLVVPALLWNFSPTQMSEARISIVRKASGEELLSLYGTHLSNKKSQPILLRQGYLISSEEQEESLKSRDPDCHAITAMPNPQSAVLLDNLHNKCLLSQRLTLASRAGYAGLIIYNFTHLNLIPKELYELKGIKMAAVSNRDANTLLKFAFPNSVRFHVRFNSSEGILQYLLQPIHSDGIPVLQNLLVFKTHRIWLLKFQAFLYGLIFFLIWRWCLVPIKFSLFRYIRDYLNWENPFDILKCDNDITLTSLQRLIIKISQRWRKEKCNKRNPYFHKRRIFHDPWTIKLTNEDFNTNCALGYGAFGKVTEERFKRNGQTVAMKRILKLESVSKLEAELLACGNCCDGIVKLLYAFASPLHINFVMEIMIGSLSDFMDDLRIPHARVYTVELGLALETLHSLGVSHRDLKPANIMLDTKYHIKLGDFGCARQFKSNESIITEDFYIGTQLYWSPENYQKQWTLESDWWAFGCIVFELFSRQHQHFLASNYMQNKLVKGEYDNSLTDRRISEAISKTTCPDDALKLIENCLDICPYRKPLGKDRKAWKAIKFIDKTELLSIPIPVNQNVDILNEFRLCSGKLPEWEVVPESRSNVSQQVEHFKMKEQICQIFYQNEESTLDEFYFDHQDFNCYKENSVIGHYFNSSY